MLRSSIHVVWMLIIIIIIGNIICGFAHHTPSLQACHPSSSLIFDYMILPAVRKVHLKQARKQQEVLIEELHANPSFKSKTPGAPPRKNKKMNPLEPRSGRCSVDTLEDQRLIFFCLFFFFFFLY